MKKLNLYLKPAFGALLVAALVAAPSVGLAKENNGNKQGQNKDRSCLKAFGHLVAPGWIKVNGQVSVSEDCKLPSGIFKKLNRNATTTTDVIAPVISDLKVEVKSSNRAVVSWDTNEKTIGAVFYGTSVPVVTKTNATSSNGTPLLGATSTNSTRIFDSSFNKDHELRLTGLNASTTYYVVIASRDATGNVTISGSTSFTTSASSDSIGPVISNIITTVGSAFVKVDWKTNEPATSKLFYSTSTVNTSSSAFVTNSTLKTNHSVTASGLATGTTYHLLPQSVDASGNVSVGAGVTVTTGI